MRKIALTLMLAVSVILVGQELDRGIAAFKAERWRDALDIFGSVLADPQATADQPEALYWTTLAAMAMGDQATAERSIQVYLTTYPKGARVPDLLYQKGRIQYGRNDWQGALVSFAAFMQAAPSHELYPSALYWSGECMYALGRLDEARRAFVAIITKYPNSVKVEAATYRRDLIDLEFREEELLRLLTWSHEESLRTVEDFRRKEKSYEQAITVYQKELADIKRGAATDSDKLIADLRSQVADLSAKLGASQADLAAAQSALAAAKAAAANERQTALQASPPAPGSVVPSSASLDAEALAAKARALDLLAFYLDKLSGGGSQ
ncbi:MAG: tetratricopeptide repeat protein [Treponema sp.]|nr:tetratricopeptide repeat protein [Treponema sp.]